MADRIVRWYQDFYRSADMEEVVVVGEDEWKILQKAMTRGERVYLGEVCGKHSEVTITLDENSFEVLSEKPEEIEFFNRILGGQVGFDMVGRVLEQWEDDEEDEEAEDVESTT